MKSKYLVIAVIGVTAAIVLGVAVYFMQSDSQKSDAVPVQAEYPEKVVYSTDADADQATLEEDCQSRGGTFNTCGSICEPDAFACATVCAFTCEFGENDLLKAHYSNADEDFIRVASPQPGQVITSPLHITGEARGHWFFEANAPVTLVDWDGRIIAQKYVMTSGEWMTTDFVPFEGMLEFELDEQNAVYDRGTLIIQRDNPSDLPENDAAIEIPVRFNLTNE